MRERVLLALGGAAAAVIAAPALAFFSPSTGAEHTVSSGRLDAPTTPSASVTDCTPLLDATLRVTVTWTPSSSAFADGYEISRATAPGGPYTVRGTVAGASASSFVDSGLAFSTTYYYVVTATRNLWRSPPTSSTSVATPGTLCL